jgi:hypothetical protein
MILLYPEWREGKIRDAVGDACHGPRAYTPPKIFEKN